MMLQWLGCQRCRDLAVRPGAFHEPARLHLVVEHRPLDLSSGAASFHGEVGRVDVHVGRGDLGFGRELARDGGAAVLARPASASFDWGLLPSLRRRSGCLLLLLQEKLGLHPRQCLALGRTTRAPLPRDNICRHRHGILALSGGGSDEARRTFLRFFSLLLLRGARLRFFFLALFVGGFAFFKGRLLPLLVGAFALIVDRTSLGGGDTFGLLFLELLILFGLLLRFSFLLPLLRQLLLLRVLDTSGTLPLLIRNPIQTQTKCMILLVALVTQNSLLLPKLVEANPTSAIAAQLYLPYIQTDRAVEQRAGLAVQNAYARDVWVSLLLLDGGALRILFLAIRADNSVFRVFGGGAAGSPFRGPLRWGRFISGS
mmetsp:Transcript_36848/g.68290  ORF Transcript_36848/g.68290 Transcript_36848/m.68290 type:complete len:371 (+) Transcript_36848:399-1511(+)